MTLDQALAYARVHQPSVLAARDRASAALADAQVPRGLWYPRGGATAQVLEGTANNSSASYFGTFAVDVPRIGGTPPAVSSSDWRPYASTFAGVGVRQEVFDFGRIGALTAVSDALARAEEQSSHAAQLNLDLAVREAFFAVKAAGAVLTAAQSAYDRVKANRDLAQVGVSNGLRAPIELTRADADLMRLDVGRIRAQGGLEIAQGVFAAVVGFPQSLLDAAGDPAALPPPPSMDQAVPDALGREPVVLEAGARLESQQARTGEIFRELLPDIQLTGLLSGRAGGAPTTTGATPTGSGYLPDVPNWDVALVLSWAWFDQSVLARRDASIAYEKAAQEELASAQLATKTAAQQAYIALDVAHRAVPALQRSVEAARANYAQADTRFRAGLGTSVELADAETVRVDAEIQLALGQFEYARARALLARAIAEAL
jgi:outer membrane protein